MKPIFTNIQTCRFNKNRKRWDSEYAECTFKLPKKTPSWIVRLAKGDDVAVEQEDCEICECFSAGKWTPSIYHAVNSDEVYLWFDKHGNAIP